MIQKMLILVEFMKWKMYRKALIILIQYFIAILTVTFVK